MGRVLLALLVAVSVAIVVVAVPVAQVAEDQELQELLAVDGDAAELRSRLESLKSGNITSVEFEEAKLRTLEERIRQGKGTHSLVRAGLVSRHDVEIVRAKFPVATPQPSPEAPPPPPPQPASNALRLANAASVVQEEVAPSPSPSPTLAPDPCLVDNGGCHEHATCHMIKGKPLDAPVCACNDGYVGDGKWYCGMFNAPFKRGETWKLHNPLEGFFASSVETPSPTPHSVETSTALEQEAKAVVPRHKHVDTILQILAIDTSA